MHTAKGGSMDASRSHFMGLVWASVIIVLFTLVATIMIISWSPLIPEAVAVDVMQGTQDFSPYMRLHEAESWHYTAALNDPLAIAHCPR
jgi:hypothetical protein